MKFSKLDECLDSYIKKTITEGKAKKVLELTPERAKVLKSWALEEAKYINTELLTQPDDPYYNWGLSEYYRPGQWNDVEGFVYQVMDPAYTIGEHYFYDEDQEHALYPELFGEDDTALLNSPDLIDYFITEVEKHIDRQQLQQFSDEVDEINDDYLHGGYDYDEDEDDYWPSSADYYDELRSFGYDPESDID